ncbi:hypothetical protein FIC_00618 [Flavobacteriaceae bacterium 3519-10]|nr:hypothetical protein FIC_00618 [Flavobacteriaceae bacterium 3519-10]
MIRNIHKYNMKLKIYFILFLIFPLQNIYSQSNEIKIYNELFKWTFSIPDYFENVSPNESEKNQLLGKKILEQKIGKELVNKSIKIYGFKSGNYNQLVVNYQPIKSKKNFTESFKQMSEVLYETLKMELPNSVITHSYSTEVISNIKFEVFDVNITGDNKNMNMKCFSAIINGKILNVQIVDQDKEKGQALISAFRKSTFKL